jgi:hypothetical protein
VLFFDNQGFPCETKSKNPYFCEALWRVDPGYDCFPLSIDGSRVPEENQRERELLREVQQAQEEYHSSPQERRATALDKYLHAVNRFSRFVLAKRPRGE